MAFTTLALLIAPAARFLQDLLACDRQAVAELFAHTAEAGPGLAKHPTVQVGLDAEGRQVVGLVGILNGLLCEADAPERLAAAYSEDGELEAFGVIDAAGEFTAAEDLK